jgi:hypothetical protein
VRELPLVLTISEAQAWERALDAYTDLARASLIVEEIVGAIDRFSLIS